MKGPFGASLMLVVPALLSAQSVPHSSSLPKVCVAVLANASTVPAFRERLTERLVRRIQASKIGAASMDSSTTLQPQLRPTRENTDEAEDKHCGYTLLTRIVDTRAHPGIPETRTPRPGAGVPSIDVTDPLGGRSGPVYREELGITFALFRGSHYDPIVDTYVLERASANVSDSFTAAMDRIANRVSHELKKK